MKKKNPIAVALGKLGAGKKKTLTPEQREAKRAALAVVREKYFARIRKNKSKLPAKSK